MTNTNFETKYAEKVRSQYVPHEETKIERLRKLDKKVRRPAEIFAYAFGSVSSLVLGTGMCFAMKVLGASIPAMFPIGIVIGVAGIGLCIANYFIYKAILKSRKKKNGDKVVALSDELLNK